MRSQARSVRTLGIVAVALTLGSAVVGCAQRPGTAATVDDWRITESYLADTVREIAPLSAEPPTAQGTLSSLISAPSYLEVAEDNGAGVSTQEAETFLASIAEQVGIDPDTEFADGVVLIAQVQVAQGKLQQSGALDAAEQITERVTEADVALNPRYGEWTDGQIQPTVFPWLITPEADSETDAPEPS
ncbi:hypothetical protein Bcav_1015 [Beutenbergia cavernae DSM 12333]|uniref:Lipoprotein n=1 Tax=Beutenbergia cavernae (strain ATCC BAA-8 / DSM 12333 / CCUG 43141 / JCM 11478 / NBRC 16432 / NCIMB 13614 / HKI 0122) TaxID=471853 RepID=C5C090_BEUC1|nr:hypothetical protein [Beutenbergia cavernae]ACQ79276.1 hypothetical protein Bcav_1015 [Beutenbergia cavernae DSM 12333]